MRKYKAFVIDGKKLVRNTCLTIIAFIIAVIGISILFHTGKTVTLPPTNIMTNMVGSALPAVGAANEKYPKVKSTFKNITSEIMTLLFSFNPLDTRTVFSAEVPTAKLLESTGVQKILAMQQPPLKSAPPISSKPSPTQAPEPTPLPENSSPIKTINSAADAQNITVSNETNYGINVEEMLNAPLSLDLSGTDPKILITHTHTTEAYAPDGAKAYDRTESDRSGNPSENVVAVGNEIAKVFESHGIHTLHDTEIHDEPSFNGAYASSLKSVERYKEQYPSIQIVFDVHRDSIVYADGTKAKVATVIDEQSAAQLMFVVGTDEGGLFHPQWRENMKFALQLQNTINKKYPKLMRRINLRHERFNGHTTNASIIIEVGTSGNSLNEAIFGATRAAECIADYLKK
ncbi:MAG: stage II sporulation protein P [Oscillospiraceae bacterium]